MKAIETIVNKSDDLALENHILKVENAKLKYEIKQLKNPEFKIIEKNIYINSITDNSNKTIKFNVGS